MGEKELHAAQFEASLLPFVNVLLAATDYLLFAELMLGSTDEARVLPIHSQRVTGRRAAEPRLMP